MKKFVIANNLEILANKHYMDKEYDSSAHYYFNSAKKFELIKFWYESAKNFRKCGMSFSFNYQDDSSLYYLQRAKKIACTNFKVYMESEMKELSEIYNFCGLINYNLLLYDSAIKNFNMSLAIADEILNLGNCSWSNVFDGKVNYYMGMTFYMKGDFINALSHYEKSLFYYGKESIIDSSRLEDIYWGIGYIHYKREDYDRALDYYYKANTLLSGDTIQMSRRRAEQYNRIGLVYYEKNDFKQSQQYFIKSLNIYKNFLDEKDPKFAHIYNNLGNIYYKNGLVDKTLDFYFNALELFIQSYGNESDNVASIYNNLAGVYLDKNQHDLALEYYYRALNIRNKIYGYHHYLVAQILRNIGDLYSQKSDYHNAIIFYDYASIANIKEKLNGSLNESYDSIISMPDMIEIKFRKAESLYKLYKNTGFHFLLKRSCDLYEQCIDISEKLRDEYDKESSKLYLSEKLKSIYTNAINTAFLLKDEARVFKFIENSKGYILNSQLKETNADLSKSIPDSLVNNKLSLKTAIRSNELKIINLRNVDKFDSLKAVVELESENFSLIQKYNSLSDFIITHYPSYSNQIKNNNFIGIKDIQNNLSINDGLIQYYIEDTLLFIFAVTSEKTIFQRHIIDRLFENKVDEHLKNIKCINPQPYLESAYAVYKILIQPIYSFMRMKQNWIIIPDNYLFYLPFESLIMNNSKDNDDFKKLDYLLNNHNIQYNYSSSMWAEGKIKKSDVGIKNNIETFAGFAPTFRNENSDLDSNNNSEIDRYKLKSIRDLYNSKKNFKELPFSKEEVEAIACLFNNSGKKGDVYLLNNATEKIFKENICCYDIIHIATHGFLDEKNPYLSGLVFYPKYRLDDSYDLENLSFPTTNVGHYSTNGNDDFLYLGEVYNLRLKASLVVLSACETGLGKLYRGEGLMALARGFISSGAQNVIFSLWKLPDKQTKDLMIYFYSEVLLGSNYAKALRKAKLKLIQSDRSVLPIFWAGLVLIGN